MSRASARSTGAALAALLVTSLAAAQTPAAPRARSSRLPAAETGVNPGPPPQTLPAPGVRAPDSSSRGRLYAPEMAGRSQAPVTARDNDTLVKAIEGKLRCTCGCNLDVFTCRTTDFTCTTSPAMHRLVLARLDSGMTAAEVQAAFVRQYGEVVLMQPPKRGFNLAAYIMPFAGLLAGLVIVGLVIRGWFRACPRTPREGGSAAEAGEVASDYDLKQLQEVLERFEA